MKAETNYYDIHAVSNTALSYFNPEEGGSLKSYLDFLSKKIDLKKYYESLYQGEMIHLAVLCPQKFASLSSIEASREELKLFNEIEEDSETALLQKVKEKGMYRTWKDETIVSKLYPKYKQFLTMKNEGKVLIENSTYETMQEAAKAIMANDLAHKMLTQEGNIIEQGFVQKDETGLMLKCKPDCIQVYGDKVVVIDLKTSLSTPQAFFYQRDPLGQLLLGSFFKYRYYRQLAFYADIVRREFEKEKVECYIIHLNTRFDYECTVIKIHPYYIEMGRKEYRSLLDKLSAALMEDNNITEMIDSPIVSIE